MWLSLLESQFIGIIKKLKLKTLMDKKIFMITY